MADRVLPALVKVRIEESGTRADQKLLDDYRLNDEGRNARQAETYSFEERELTDSLTELGLTPGQLRDAHEMGNLMTLELLAPNQRQAVRLGKLFEKKAEAVYNLTMAELLDDEDEADD